MGKLLMQRSSRFFSSAAAISNWTYRVASNFVFVAVALAFWWTVKIFVKTRTAIRITFKDDSGQVRIFFISHFFSSYWSWLAVPYQENNVDGCHSFGLELATIWENRPGLRRIRKKSVHLTLKALHSVDLCSQIQCVNELVSIQDGYPTFDSGLWGDAEDSLSKLLRVLLVHLFVRDEGLPCLATVPSDLWWVEPKLLKNPFTSARIKYAVSSKFGEYKQD